MSEYLNLEHITEHPTSMKKNCGDFVVSSFFCIFDNRHPDDEEVIVTTD